MQSFLIFVLRALVGRLGGIAVIFLLFALPAIAESKIQLKGGTLPDGADSEAVRAEGETLIYATDPAVKNVEAGIALLEKSAAAGNLKATLSLGSIYLYGLVTPVNRDRARGYFDQAAAAGDGSGLAQYGMMLMWGEADWSVAEKTLTEAAEMGATEAWATLAEGAMYGYLGGGTFSRSKFNGYAEKARAAGNARIEVLDAIRQMWGISMRANGPATIAKLVAAADAGNADAAKFLISLLRDGNGMNIARDRDAAVAAVASYSSLLSDAEIWTFTVSLMASHAPGTDGYAKVAAEVAARPDLVTKPLGVELQRANPRAAIYVLQSRLQARGLYDGPLDGWAGKGTLRAMYRACDGLLNRTACDDNVLRPDVIAALITAN